MSNLCKIYKEYYNKTLWAYLSVSTAPLLLTMPHICHHHCLKPGPEGMTDLDNVGLSIAAHSCSMEALLAWGLHRLCSQHSPRCHSPEKEESLLVRKDKNDQLGLLFSQLMIFLLYSTLLFLVVLDNSWCLLLTYEYRPSFLTALLMVNLLAPRTLASFLMDLVRSASISAISSRRKSLSMILWLPPISGLRVRLSPASFFFLMQ